MIRTLTISACALLTSALVSGCATDEAALRRQVRHGGKEYVVVFAPSRLTGADKETYAEYYMDGFKSGLGGDCPLFHSQLKRAIVQGFSDGNDQGLREYARYHWDDVRERLPGLYADLQAEGFKPVRR